MALQGRWTHFASKRAAAQTTESYEHALMCKRAHASDGGVCVCLLRRGTARCPVYIIQQWQPALVGAGAGGVRCASRIALAACQERKRRNEIANCEHQLITARTEQNKVRSLATHRVKALLQIDLRNNARRPKPGSKSVELWSGLARAPTPVFAPCSWRWPP